MTSDAVAPLPSSILTLTGTGPSVIGAVHDVCVVDGVVSMPAGARQAYVSGSPSGSFASAESVDVFPIGTVQGSQRAWTVGGRFVEAA